MKPVAAPLDGRQRALFEVGTWLRSRGYRFVPPTPATHQRVIERARRSDDVRDVFGWSRPFAEPLLPAAIFGLLHEAEALERAGDLWRSKVRYATLGDDLFVHSAFPTDDASSVFFGPDTYRFASLIERECPRRAGLRVVDVGCGSGAGGIAAARCADGARVVLADINPSALQAAAVNAALAGVPCELAQSDVLAGTSGDFDLVLANPPYLSDPAERTYRHGGGAHGADLSVRIVRETLPRLAAGGRLVLYTGAAVVNGVDVLRAALAPILRGHRARYFEIDPDVFGEELSTPAYAEVERIAAVGLVVDLEPT